MKSFLADVMSTQDSTLAIYQFSFIEPYYAVTKELQKLLNECNIPQLALDDNLLEDEEDSTSSSEKPLIVRQRWRYQKEYEKKYENLFKNKNKINILSPKMKYENNFFAAKEQLTESFGDYVEDSSSHVPASSTSSVSPVGMISSSKLIGEDLGIHYVKEYIRLGDVEFTQKYYKDYLQLFPSSDKHFLSLNRLSGGSEEGRRGRGRGIMSNRRRKSSYKKQITVVTSHSEGSDDSQSSEESQSQSSSSNVYHFFEGEVLSALLAPLIKQGSLSLRLLLQLYNNKQSLNNNCRRRIERKRERKMMICQCGMYNTEIGEDSFNEKGK